MMKKKFILFLSFWLWFPVWETGTKEFKNPKSNKIFINFEKKNSLDHVNFHVKMLNNKCYHNIKILQKLNNIIDVLLFVSSEVITLDFRLPSKKCYTFFFMCNNWKISIILPIVDALIISSISGILLFSMMMSS